tara:strand:+ start:13546 stop:13710 length:165 start_codon:yes stop_codon:yes gene_type:complete
MGIWNKGKDAGNKAWGTTTSALSTQWVVVKDFHVNGYNKGVSGAKWVGKKVKFW